MVKVKRDEDFNSRFQEIKDYPQDEFSEVMQKTVLLSEKLLERYLNDLEITVEEEIKEHKGYITEMLLLQLGSNMIANTTVNETIIDSTLKQIKEQWTKKNENRV